MTFAYMTIHPIKMDGVVIPGSQRGRPTNERDTDNYIHACGTAGYLRLDGRCRRSLHLEEIREYMHRHQRIQKFAGFEIHVGEIRKSKAVACYRVINYTAAGVSYQSIPLSKAAPN